MFKQILNMMTGGVIGLQAKPEVETIEIARGVIFKDTTDAKFPQKKMELQAHRLKDGESKYKVIVWKRKADRSKWSESRLSRRGLKSLAAFAYFKETLEEKAEKESIKYYT